MTDALRELASACFGTRGASTDPRREIVDATIAVVGVGLDHEAGERAWIARPHEDHSHSVTAALLVTDRRIAGVKHMPGDVHLTGPNAGFAVPGCKAFMVPHASVRSLELMLPLVGTEHRVRLDDGTIARIPRCGSWPKLRSFIDGVLELPAGQRSAEDVPLDAERAVTDAWSAVESHVDTLRAKGEIEPETARDLIARVCFHRRSCRLGTGGAGSRWTTALSADDLAHVLARVLGVPARASTDPPVLEFALATPDRSAELLLANMLGLGSLAAFGIGGVVFPGVTVRSVRAEIESAMPACRYALFCDRGEVPLHARRPDLVAALHCAVRRAEADLLVRRCALGWSLRASELWAIAPGEILARYQRTTPALRLVDLPGPPP